MLLNNISLIDAIKNGNKQLALKLIHEGVDLKEEVESEPLLSAAIYQEDKEILLVLIEKGADVNQVDSTIRTPLMHAMNVENFKEIMQILIDKGANVNQEISRGERNSVTPLAVACESAEPEIISFLIDKGADMNWVNEEGDSLLSFAMRPLEWNELGKQFNSIAEEQYLDNKNRVDLAIKELLKSKLLAKVQNELVVEKILESAIKFDVPSFSEIYAQLRESTLSKMVFQKAMEIAFKYEKMDPLWKKGVLSDQEKTEIIQYEISRERKVTLLNCLLGDEWGFENTLDLAIESNARFFDEIYEYLYKDVSLREKLYQRILEILAKHYKARDYYHPVNILNTLFKNGEMALASGENKTLPPLLVEDWLKNIFPKLTVSEQDKLFKFCFPDYRLPYKGLEEYFSKIHQRIIIDKRESQLKEPLPLAHVNLPCQVVYNNDSYLQSTTNESFKYSVKGNPLQYDKTPIGYNIHLPNKDIKAVYFSVYGGDKKGVSGLSPNELSRMEDYLLSQGIAVVTLNLPDLLELSVWAGKMPEKLHDKIHACINHVYHVFRTNPENLHPQLLSLYAKRFILSGTSFGGRTAVMQAELYPNTFDGYISFEGALSNKMRSSSDFPQFPRGESLPHLDPANESRMKKINQDILIIQNSNDINVNAKVALDFYRKMKKLGKSERVRLWMVDEGGKEGKEGKEREEGHDFTANPHELFYLRGVVQQFINEGKSKLDTLHEWRAYKHDLLANKHYQKATIMEKFLADMFQIELPSKIKINRENIDVLWEEHYAPIFRAHFYAEELSGNVSQLNLEANYLQHALTDQHIINTLQSQKQLFIKFCREELEMALTPQEFEEELKKPAIINSFRMLITALPKQKNKYIHYFLNAIYQANPHLTKGERFQTYSLESKLNAEPPKAKQKLLSVYLKEKRMIAFAWKEAAKKAREVDLSKSPIPPASDQKRSTFDKK